MKILRELWWAQSINERERTHIAVTLPGSTMMRNKRALMLRRFCVDAEQIRPVTNATRPRS